MADGSVAYDVYHSDNPIDFFVAECGSLRLALEDKTVAIYAQGSWDRLTTDDAEKIQ